MTTTRFIFMFFSFICWVARKILSLRYSVKIVGKENLSPEVLDKKEGILFLPNHPALLDPLYIILFFWPRFRMRPLVIEYVYRQKWLKRFMKIVKPLPIPNFESSINEVKLRNADIAFDEIIKGLKENNSFLLYPSGRLKHGGKEVIGGASATHSIIQECKNTNVVLIRTTGFWGSSFSRAITRKAPDIKKTFLKNALHLLKNFIFFMPRRKLLIEIESNPKDFPFKSTRVELNRYLENWYNQYPVDGKRVEIEPLKLVSYSIFYKKVPRVKKSKKEEKIEKVLEEVPKKNQKKINEELAELAQTKPGEIEPDMNLALDLALDSLDLANLVAFLSDQFNVKQVPPEELETVKHIYQASVGEIEPRKEEEESTLTWPEEKKRYHPYAPCGKTIMEAFLRSCDHMKDFQCCADDVAGVLSYRKMKMAALILSKKVKEIEGKYIGIMLPASVGAYLLIMATMLAKKVPVMFNWTLGPKPLNATYDLAKVKYVITSWKFLEKLSYVEFGKLVDKLLLLEDIKEEISLKDKVKGMLLSKLSFSSILKKLDLDKKGEESVAAILFTSGTEALPKGVPLTHKNLLSNQHATLQCVDFTYKEIVCGILPPFHSFGFSVAGLLPILCGIKAVYYPDPTNGFGVAQTIKRWNANLLCAAPSFLKNILHAAKEKELKGLHYVVTGAEKTPKSLFKEVEKQGKNIITIEGYGITECAPVISLTRPNQKKVGVGQPLPNIEVCTIHPETQKLQPEHAEGEICVHGPNIFNGYLGEVQSPFIEIDGVKWYRTGDLGHIDKKDNIILSGRLKRFAKIGAEMVSLGAIEEELAQTLPSKDDQHSLAVCVNEEDETKSSLILFTTFDVELKKVNQILKEAGFSRLIKITRIESVDSIPLLGTGKVDYQTLQSLANQS